MKKNIKKILVGIVTICVIGVTGSIIYLNNTKEDATITTSNTNKSKQVKTKTNNENTTNNVEQINTNTNTDKEKANKIFAESIQSLTNDTFYSDSVLKVYGWYNTTEYFDEQRFDFNDTTCLSQPATIIDSNDHYVIYKYDNSDIYALIYNFQPEGGSIILNYISSDDMQWYTLFAGPTEEQLEQEKIDQVVVDIINDANNKPSERDRQLAILRDEYAQRFYGKPYEEICGFCGAQQLKVNSAIYEDWYWNGVEYVSR